MVDRRSTCIQVYVTSAYPSKTIFPLLVLSYRRIHIVDMLVQLSLQEPLLCTQKDKAARDKCELKLHASQRARYVANRLFDLIAHCFSQWRQYTQVASVLHALIMLFYERSLPFFLLHNVLSHGQHALCASHVCISRALHVCVANPMPMTKCTCT